MSKILEKKVIEGIDKLHGIGNEIQEYIVEREEVIEIIKIALVSQKNVFFLGATGQSKTYSINEFVKRITDVKYFEQLMDKTSDKSVLFGNISIPELQKGKEVYIKKNKLSEANIASLEEFWKSGDVLLNTLLKVLNKEEITLGEETIKPPLLTVFTASNELPNFKNKEEEILYPLYNRLHLKVLTNYIEKKDNFKKALKAKRNKRGENINITISLSELELLNEKAWEIEVPDYIDDLLWDICEAISREMNRKVSDRKKIEYSIICQANALLNKRETVIPEDLLILKYYLWEFPEEYSKIQEIIKMYAENPLKDEVMGIRSIANELIDEATKNIDDLKVKDRNKVFTKAENELFSLHFTLVKLKEDCKSVKDAKLIDETFIIFQELYDKLTKSHKFTQMPIQEAKERQGLV